MFKALTTSAFVAIAFASAGNATAASVTYNLDQSNVLADGVVYLKVTISDSAKAGEIDFMVETTTAFTAGDNFGIQVFGFNPDSNLNIKAENIKFNDASIWEVGSGNLSGFGLFDITGIGDGSSRQNPLTFSIIDVDGDTIASYANPSAKNAGGWEGDENPFFAAHVAGFTSDLKDAKGKMVTSAFFAGSTAELPPNLVPVPAATWLLGSGLLGLVGVARRKGQA